MQVIDFCRGLVCIFRGLVCSLLGDGAVHSGRTINQLQTTEYSESTPKRLQTKQPNTLIVPLNSYRLFT